MNPDDAEYVLVGLCVNDDYGNFTGKVCKIDIEDGVDMLVELEHAEMLEEGGGEPIQIDYAFIVIGNRHYDIETDSHATMVGNALWDAVRMEETVARQMVRDLVEGDWDATVCAEEWALVAKFWSK